MSLLALLAASAASTPPPDLGAYQGLYGPGLLHPGVTAMRMTSTTTLPAETSSMPEDIIKVGDTYWMTYTHWPETTTRVRIHLASGPTPDGPWTPYAGNPILTSGSLPWESEYTNACSLLEHEGTFYLFYASDTPDQTSSGGAISVATATSVTGPYTKHGTKLVDVGPPGWWESRRVQEPHVIVAPDGTWVMTYMAEPMDVPEHKGEKVGIATAPGPFGPWTKSPSNPVVGFGAPGTWDSACIADSSLFYDNGTWWMLYSAFNDYTSGGHPWGIGLVYATDIHGPWTRIPTNPILSGSNVAGTFDRQSIWRGSIYYENGVYHFPFAGMDTAVMYAKAGAAQIVL